jgi:hypothetical protein
LSVETCGNLVEDSYQRRTYGGGSTEDYDRDGGRNQGIFDYRRSALIAQKPLGRSHTAGVYSSRFDRGRADEPLVEPRCRFPVLPLARPGEFPIGYVEEISHCDTIILVLKL